VTFRVPDLFGVPIAVDDVVEWENPTGTIRAVVVDAAINYNGQRIGGVRVTMAAPGCQWSIGEILQPMLYVLRVVGRRRYSS
jgi:hypothetical protein